MAHPHLRPISDQIPEAQRDTDILLLIGRDVPPLHKVRESRNGRGNSPWAQRLDLGWVILGNTCLDGVHKPNGLSFKTHLLHNGRPSIFEPCSNVFHVDKATSAHTDSHESIKNSVGKSRSHKESSRMDLPVRCLNVQNLTTDQDTLSKIESSSK
jgi:hypothetical protein